jgi:hypothetical protein
MKEQNVRIKFSPLSLTVDSHESYLWDITEKVRGVSDIRKVIRDELRTTIRKFQRHLTSYFSVTVQFEDGSNVHVPVNISLFADIDPKITAGTLKVAQRKEVAIRFGDRLHNMLYLISKGVPVWRGSKSSTTLEVLGLTKGGITEKGKEVLEQLTKIGPGNTRRGLVQTAKLLLHSSETDSTPLMEWAQGQGLLGPTPNRWDVMFTDKGKAWLKKYAPQLIRYREAVRWRADLIPYLPKESLNEFLASRDHGVRSKAEARMKELEGIPINVPDTSMNKFIYLAGGIK